MTDKHGVRWWRREWMPGLLLVLATLLSYQPAWNGEPVFDDEDHLTPPELRSLDGLRRIWTEVGVVSQYYPIMHTAFWLEHRLWGESMLGYHLVNILLHAGAALLLIRILKELAVPGAWLAGAVFALHPVHAESVAWISELKNTLSALCGFGAVLAYLRFDATRHRGFYVAALILFVAGLLAKAVIATLPAALLVVFWWKRGRLAWRRDGWPMAPFFVLGICQGLFAAWVERKFIGAEGEAFDLSLVQRGLIAGRVIWFYAGKLLWPVELTFIYPRWTISATTAWQYLFPFAALMAAWVCWRMRRRSRGPLAALLLFVGTLFPVLGFLNVYPFLYSFVADHYQYLASVNVIAAVIAGAVLAWRRVGWGQAIGRIVGITLVAGLATMTWRQSRMYAGVETLWRITLERNPACFVAHSNLSHHLLQEGRVEEAIAHGRQASALRPDFAEVHNNLGNALLARGQVNAARVEYQRALELRPDLAVAHFNLGAILLQEGRLDDAADHFEAAIARRPEFVKPRVSLARLLLDRGQVDEAIVHLLSALEVSPDDPDALTNLGNARLSQGRTEEATEHYGRALAIAPDSAPTHHNLGAARLQAGRVEEALTCFARAVALQPDFAPAHYQRGNVLLQLGRFDEAVPSLQKAVALQPAFAAGFNDLGVALAQSGRSEAALANFQQALALEPEFAEAKDNVARLLAFRAGDNGN